MSMDNLERQIEELRLIINKLVERVDHLEAELKKKDESTYYENWEASFPGKSENDSKK